MLVTRHFSPSLNPSHQGREGISTDSKSIVRLLHGVPDAWDIGTNEHEEYIAQDAQNQTKYSQNPDGMSAESSGHPLQRNSRKSDG